MIRLRKRAGQRYRNNLDMYEGQIYDSSHIVGLNVINENLRKRFSQEFIDNCASLVHDIDEHSPLTQPEVGNQEYFHMCYLANVLAHQKKNRLIGRFGSNHRNELYSQA